MPEISVIMGVYNELNKDILMEAVNSILHQTFEDFEFIIYDDGSCPEAATLLREVAGLDERIKLIGQDENHGLAFSLNACIDEAKGKYIARMDTDDYSYKHRLEDESDFLENNPEYDVIGGNVDYYDGSVIWGKTNNCQGIIKKEDILNSVPLCHPTVMAKREVYLAVGGYPNFKRCEDYALWIELFSKGYKLYRIKNTVLRYHLSLEDYKKRTLKTRKDFFRLLNTQYTKLNPTKSQIIKIKIKNIIAGIMPYKIMYWYHRNKARRRNV